MKERGVTYRLTLLILTYEKYEAYRKLFALKKMILLFNCYCLVYIKKLRRLISGKKNSFIKGQVSNNKFQRFYVLRT